jgi:hypothetical protein
VRAQINPCVGPRVWLRPRRPPRTIIHVSRYAKVASVSASKMACMFSALPIKPSSATDFSAATTSSIPGRFAATKRAPSDGVWAPPGPKMASYSASLTGPSRPSSAAPEPPQTSGVSPRDA